MKIGGKRAMLLGAIIGGIGATAAQAQPELLNLECRSRSPEAPEMHVYWVDYSARTITDALAAPGNARAIDRSSMAVFPVTITDRAFTFINNGAKVTIDRVTGVNTIPLEGYTLVLHCTRGDNPFPPDRP